MVSRHPSRRKDLGYLLEQARRDGYEVRRTPGGHVQVRHPDGERMVHIPPDPGGSRGWQNAVNQLARIGVGVGGDAGGEEVGARCGEGCDAVLPSEDARAAHHVAWHRAGDLGVAERAVAAVSAVPGGLSASELAAAMGVPTHQLNEVTRDLRAGGVLRRDGDWYALPG